MTLQQISKLLNAPPVDQHANLAIEINSAVASDLMSDVLLCSQAGSLLITGLTNNQVIRTCEIAGISAILFVRNKIPTPETIMMAREQNIPLLMTRTTMFETCGILYAHGITGVNLKD